MRRSVLILKPHGGFFPPEEEFKQAAWKEIFANGEIYSRFAAKQQELNNGASGDCSDLIMAALECGRDDNRVAALLKVFDSKVQVKIAESSIPQAVLGALEELAEREVSLVLLSSAPRRALEQTVAGWSARNDYDLEALFSMVLGGPQFFEDNLEAICTRNGVYKNQMYVVGDRRSDWVAATNHGMKFIALEDKAKPGQWSGLSLVQQAMLRGQITSLAQLPALFDSLGL